MQFIKDYEKHKVIGRWWLRINRNTKGDWASWAARQTIIAEVSQEFD